MRTVLHPPRFRMSGLGDMRQQRKTQIHLYELLAVVCAWETFGQQLAGHRVTVFIDNQCALNMLIKGWSRADDANELAIVRGMYWAN